MRHEQHFALGHRIGVALLGFATAACGQSFSYPAGSSFGSLQLRGQATPVLGHLQLFNGSGATGWAWHAARVPITAGFDTTFTFSVSTSIVPPGGIAFVIQDDPRGPSAIGGDFEWLGYGAASGIGGIQRSLVLELDVVADNWLGDAPAGNELSIHTRGTSPNDADEQWSIGRTTVASMVNSQHTVRMRYVPGTLEVYYDDLTNPRMVVAWSFETGGLYRNGQPAPSPSLSNGSAWVGFSATGAFRGYNSGPADIQSWTWTSTPLRDACYAGTLGDAALRINGSPGEPDRRLDVRTFHSFTIDMASVAGGGLPWALVASLAPTPGVPAANPPFGNMCMSVLPFGPTEFVLADGFGAFGGALAVGPTPYRITVPVPGIPFDLDATVQAVAALDPSLASLGISNAIDLRFRLGAAPVIDAVQPQIAAPGTLVTISGSGFTSNATVAVSGVPATVVSSSSTQIVFAYPTNPPCNAVLSVTLTDGQTATATLNPGPRLNFPVTPASGSTAGGQIVQILGTGFAAGSSVTIGGAPATVTFANFNIVTAVTPPGTPGTATVVVTRPDGCFATGTYTYQ